jgi:hypothetical protein
MSRFSGPTPSNGPSNQFARIKIIKSKRHIKNRYIGNFMYMSFCVLYSVLFSVCCEFYMHEFQGPTLPVALSVTVKDLIIFKHLVVVVSHPFG